jgi:hypothetical protein
MASEDGFDPDVMSKPSAEKRPVEAIIGKNIVKRTWWVAPILIIPFGIISGWLGAVSSAMGIAIVVVNFLVGGYLLSTAARVSLGLYHAAALAGFFIRLGLMTLMMVIIVSLVDVDRFALGVSAVVSYVVLLSLEAIAVTRGAERELEWTN